MDTFKTRRHLQVGSDTFDYFSLPELAKKFPAVEVLVATGRVFDKIADPSATHELEELIAEGEYYGMQTFDQSIFGLLQQGLVSYEEALRWASNVDEFKLKVQGISTTADISRDEMAKGIIGAAPEITRFRA